MVNLAVYVLVFLVVLAAFMLVWPAFRLYINKRRSVHLRSYYGELQYQDMFGNWEYCCISAYGFRDRSNRIPCKTKEELEKWKRKFSNMHELLYYFERCSAAERERIEKNIEKNIIY